MHMQYEQAWQRYDAQKTRTDETNINDLVRHYKDWLVLDAERTASHSSSEDIRKYTEESLSPVLFDGTETRTFAPFRQLLSARQTLTSGQSRFLLAFGLLWLLGLILFGVKILIITLAGLIVFYLSTLLVSFILSTKALAQPTEEQISDEVVKALVDARWPRYTLLCPLYHEAAIAPQFVRAMQALDYPTDKLEILLLTEEDDAETRQALQKMHLPSHFSVITVPPGKPRTKPRACNFGLLQATGDYVVIYDVEDVPDPLQLKKAVLTFANHGSDLACVQAKLNYYNTAQNLLTRWFTVEYSSWFDLVLPGMQQIGVPMPLGGTSNHFRTEKLRTLGAWDAFNVTEDCDLGLRMARAGLKTAMLDSTTYEEANPKVKNWLRQRSRWIKGYMQTYLVHMRLPLYYLRQKRLREFFSLQIFIGGKTFVLFINPFMWLLTVIYILFRPVNLYHTLFPPLMLYMGTLCLVFGNFFYAYSHLVGCLKRGQYGLIKWALLTPSYWLMMSTAAFIALFQLITKPHYWEKTQHGLHLFKSHSSVRVTAITEESQQASITEESQQARLLSQPAPAVKTIRPSIEVLRENPAPVASPSLPVTAFSENRHVSLLHPKSLRNRYLPQDRWLVAIFLIACIASVASCWYFFQHHQIILYSDAISHLRIARRVVDNSPPGFAQLGGIWLPLPQLLMLPFIWNNYLWRTGLAGSFVGMVCYLVATVYLFLAARRLTRDSRASFVGTLLFVLNPNVLYLQATPLSEIICVSAMVIACYHFLAWSQDNRPINLVGTAVGTFLTSVSRYDGWGLFLVILVLIVCVGLIKRQRWSQIEGNLLTFVTLGCLGIVLWVLWDLVILGDPLYFHDYLYSSATATSYYTYHNISQSVLVYMLTSIETVGPILFVLSAIAVVVFFLRLRFEPEIFAAIVFFTPFVFYILIFYIGEDTIYLPGVGPANTPHTFWNVRFGVQAVAPVALFLSILAKRWSPGKLARPLTTVAPWVLVIVIGVQVLLTAHGGIISLQDGTYSGSCEPTDQITIYLVQHYTGGKILEDVNAFPVNEAEAGINLRDTVINLRDTVYEGSSQWKQALKDPASEVDWIIAPSLSAVPNDLIATHINMESPAFLSQYTLALQQSDGLRLYHRNGSAPLANRTVPSYLYSEHRLCGT